MSPTRRLSRLVSALAACTLIAAVSACADDDSAETAIESTTGTHTETEPTAAESDPNPALADPCDLLTDEELRSLGATENSLGVNRPDDFNGVFPGCTFGAFASIYVGISEGWMDAGDGEPVSGIGDEAFFSPSWSRLTVRFGEDRLMFQLGIGGQMDVSDDESALRSMAELVQTKL